MYYNEDRYLLFIHLWDSDPCQVSYFLLLSFSCELLWLLVSLFLILFLFSHCVIYRSLSNQKLGLAFLLFFFYFFIGETKNRFQISYFLFDRLLKLMIIVVVFIIKIDYIYFILLSHSYLFSIFIIIMYFFFIFGLLLFYFLLSNYRWSCNFYLCYCVYFCHYYLHCYHFSHKISWGRSFG